MSLLKLAALLFALAPLGAIAAIPPVFSNTPGYATELSNTSHYSQAVRLEGVNGSSIIKVSGQGGWDPETGAINDTDIAVQVDQAFANVDQVLKNAGSAGWNDVYYGRAFLIRPFDDSLFDVFVNASLKWYPDRKPALTAVGTPFLVLPGMRIEFEVEAWVDG